MPDKSASLPLRVVPPANGGRMGFTMYTKEITTFLAVAKTGSFAKAAKELFTTPVSVMNQINSLESYVGTPLLKRTNHGVRLTAAGETFRQDAERMVRLARSAVQKAQKAALAEQQVIRIGTSILRPCRPLIDLWNRQDSDTQAFQIQIVPFSDDPASLTEVLHSFGRDIDCFVGPCDSETWSLRYSILPLGNLPCRVALSRKLPLAAKSKLSWQDLKNHQFLMVKRGESKVLNRLRDEILTSHPDITLVDTPDFYDTSVFNLCEQKGYVMESLDIWKEIHPGLVTLPMEWDYEMPFGIIYAKIPSPAMKEFIAQLEQRL